MARYTLMVHDDYSQTGSASPFVNVEADSLDDPPTSITPVDPTDVRHVDTANDLRDYQRKFPETPTGVMAHGHGYFKQA